MKSLINVFLRNLDVSIFLLLTIICTLRKPKSVKYKNNLTEIDIKF
ncbi:hypothetical protein [Clostridium botulinum]|nr:hypothetical protein [Clostridium botulinum]MCD3204412.1 hypothetical protein [Clostridium botulinum C/D]MCD3223985.1 hypothetical protein [Clostridium botulinum C/D]MCD3232393.1 hypothetical protein [Clostridium botulinum C/D]MCD3274642.1 hypothetical protein [Clostridium botulinum C/D]MCD3297624.1 hypothetical protein [Clostridium botulinum C/D]